MPVNKAAVVTRMKGTLLVHKGVDKPNRIVMELLIDASRPASRGIASRRSVCYLPNILKMLGRRTLVYFGYGSVSMSVTTTPSTSAPAQTQK
jgi:hypothetical protein